MLENLNTRSSQDYAPLRVSCKCGHAQHFAGICSSVCVLQVWACAPMLHRYPCVAKRGASQSFSNAAAYVSGLCRGYLILPSASSRACAYLLCKEFLLLITSVRLCSRVLACSQ
eukprot:scaffold141668_cov22-Tisochrysis_lutea.AAC.1